MNNETATNVSNEAAGCCGTKSVENTATNENTETKTSGGCCGGGNKPTVIGSLTEKEPMASLEGNTAASNENITVVVAPEIVCGSCATSIKNAVGRIPGVTNVEVDVASKKVTVDHDENVTRERIAYVLDRAGYTVSE